MRAVLAEILPSAEHLIFDNAPDAVAFLKVHCTQTILVSLDHDLGPACPRDGQFIDPGDGRDVVAFLVDCHPSCPIIVHSANYQMAPIMIEMLREAGWFAGIVTPYSQLALTWIEAEWRAEIEWLIANGRINPNKTNS